MDNSQGGYVYPKGSTVPTVEIAVGENLYTINPEDFAYGDGDKGTVFGGVCNPNLLESPKGSFIMI